MRYAPCSELLRNAVASANAGLSANHERASTYGKEPRQLVVKPRVVRHDGGHRRAERLLDVAGRERRQQALLRRLGPQEHDPSGTRVGARRSVLHEIVDLAELLFRHRAIQPRGMRAGLAEEPIEARRVEFARAVDSFPFFLQ